MSINQNIVIKPNQPGKTPITGSNLNYLKNNIFKLNLIYNSILKHICINSLNQSHYILQNVKVDFASIGINPNSEFCYDNVSGVPGAECTDALFKDHHLINTINQLKANNVTKICVYKQLTQTTSRLSLSPLVQFNPFVPGYVYLNQPHVRSHSIVDKPTTINANVQIIGGASDTSLELSVRELLMSDISNMSKPNYMNLGKIITEQNQNCINIEGKEICTIRKKNHNCTLCKKWSIEREQFKKAIVEMITLDNYLDIFDVMCKSAIYLPAAVLEQDEYNSYYENLNEFKAFKKNASY
jgi:hypothetical protein